MNAVKKAPWFAYFPDDYRWSAAVSITYSCSYWGASTMGEIHSACKICITNSETTMPGFVNG